MRSNRWIYPAGNRPVTVEKNYVESNFPRNIWVTNNASIFDKLWPDGFGNEPGAMCKPVTPG